MMLAVRRLTIGALSLLLTHICYAAHADNASKFESRSFPTSNIQSYSYRSSSMDRVYDISIGFPAGYDQNPDKKYPALIVTDGNRAFPIVHSIISGVAARSQGNIEAPVIISIGTPYEEGEMAHRQRRVFEFSPPNWEMEDTFGQQIKGLCENMLKIASQDCVGGAPKFLDFIASELLPDLYKAHRIDPDDLGLFGISAGGFFATWAIFQENSPFNRYLISSPAMAYGDGEIFRQEARYAETHKDLPVSIYLGSGMLEMDDPFLEGVGKIVSGHAHLAGTLRTRNYPNLKLYSEMHQGMGHMDTPAVVAARGLRLLYTK